MNEPFGSLVLDIRLDRRRRRLPVFDRVPAGHADTLMVRDECQRTLALRNGSGNCIVQQGELRLQGGLAATWDNGNQGLEQGTKASIDLVLVGAKCSDLAQGELDEIFPGGRRVDKSGHPPVVDDYSDREMLA